MTIQTTIRAAMHHHQITQRKLAALVGCRPATISDFLNGKYGLSSDTLEKILKTLSLTIKPVI